MLSKYMYFVCVCVFEPSRFGAYHIEVFQKLSLPEQPLADAKHYKNQDVIQLLEKHGATQLVSPSFYESIPFFFLLLPALILLRVELCVRWLPCR